MPASSTISHCIWSILSRIELLRSSRPGIGAEPTTHSACSHAGSIKATKISLVLTSALAACFRAAAKIRATRQRSWTCTVDSTVSSAAAAAPTVSGITMTHLHPRSSAHSIMTCQFKGIMKALPSHACHGSAKLSLMAGHDLHAKIGLLADCEPLCRKCFQQVDSQKVAAGLSSVE